MFKNRLWTPQLAYLIGLIALVSLPWRASMLWLVAAFAVYMVLTCIISVGMHRLFCHGSFQTTSFFRNLFALGSVLPVLGSPIQWSTIHNAHHKHADKEGDPHPAAGRLWALVVRQYRSNPSTMWCSRRLLTDPIQVHVHRYYALIWLVVFGAMCLISKDFAFNAYLPGLGLLQLVTSINVIIAHQGGRPRDWPFLEFIFPACGEWSHVAHHKRPGNVKLGRFDLGYVVINMISVNRELRTRRTQASH